MPPTRENPGLGEPPSVHQVPLTHPLLAEDSTRRGTIREKRQRIRLQKGYIKSQDSTARIKPSHLAVSIPGYSLLMLKRNPFAD